jgi:hypothetical protein
MNSPAPVSRRESILQHVADRFRAMREGQDDYTTTWNAVVRRPLTKAEVSLGNAIGMYDTEEEKVSEIGRYRSTLTVVIEFFHTLKHGEEPSTELNRMLADVQRAMRVDVTCGGLSYNVVETKNELDIDGPADRLVAGIVEFQISYKHTLDDPRLP